jgi:tRNA1(Val) A37 N6-methylase TrmN6
MIKDFSNDTLIWPDLKLVQPRKGYRYGLDTVVRSRLVKNKKDADLLEIGSGSGVALFIIARRGGFRSLTGIEIDKELYCASLKNLETNRASSRIKFVHGDIRKYSLSCKKKFEIIISNPPFYGKGSGRLSKDSRERGARHELSLNLAQMLDCTTRLLSQKGSLYLVYNSDRTGEVIHELYQRKIMPKVLMPVYPKHPKDSNLIWLKAVNNAKSGLKLIGPLVCYDQSGRKTAEYGAFYKKNSDELKRLFPSLQF